MIENIITIITSLIPAIATIVVCIITSSATKNLLEYRLTQLEEKVDKHNNLIERTYELEKQVAIIKDDLRK